MTIRKIRRVSSIMSVLCVIGMIGLPLSLAIGWSSPEIFSNSLPGFENPWNAFASLSPTERVLGFLVSMIPAGVMIFGLAGLRHLFRLYEAGDIFSVGSARYLKRFAISVMLQAILRPLAGTLHTVIFTFNNAPGEKMLAVSFGDGEFAAVLLGGLLLVIGWIIGEGAKIAAENRQFI